MPEYKVTWEINIYANSPYEAALEAEQVQRGQTTGNGLRGVFGVQSYEDGKSYHIDLSELT